MTKIFLITIFFSILTVMPSKIQAKSSLNSSVMIFHHRDLLLCPLNITKVAKRGNKKVHIVPTINSVVDPISKKVLKFKYQVPIYQYAEFSPDYLHTYHKLMRDCLNTAFDLGLEVYLTPHLDTIDNIGGYRNEVIYDPLEKHGLYSFKEIMFDYLKKMKLRKPVYLSLIGEMGASLRDFPHSYKKIVNNLKNKNLNLGLSFNFNKLLGGLDNRGQELTLNIDWINNVDFLGVSAYYPIKQNCTWKSFEKHILNFKKQMSNLGLSNSRVRFHFTEVGIGGGHIDDPEMSARHPYHGIYGDFSKDKNPWKSAGMSVLRQNYHYCLLDFLEKTENLQAAFLWNSNSFDVQGIYAPTVGYEDLLIIQSILGHNQKSIFFSGR